jgi:hypothetical protein
MCYKQRVNVMTRRLLDGFMEKNLLRNAKIYKLVLVQLLTMGLFANSFLVQACFCGEACAHGLQEKGKTKPGLLFHHRCPGTRCQSCGFEDGQTIKASNSGHPTAKLNTLHTPFILSNFSDCRPGINSIKIFLSCLDKCVKAQSPPTYLQNLSFLL